MFYYLFDSVGALTGPMEFPVTPGIGVQLPSNAIELSFELPLPEAGRSWALVNNVPRELIDCRGVVYHKDSGRQQLWDEFGPLPQTLTAEPYPGDHHIWVDEQWVLDGESQLNGIKVGVLVRRDALLGDAILRIAPLQYAEDMGEATDEEQLALMEWKLYSVELNRIHHQAGFPKNINWPMAPVSAA